MKVFVIIFLLFLTSCATLLHNKSGTTEYQKKKPTAGETKREVRPAELTLNLLFCVPCVLVDIYTGQVYRPECKKCVEKK